MQERKSKRHTASSKQQTVNSKQQTASGNSRSQIPDSKSQIPDSRFPIPNSQFEIPTRNPQFDVPSPKFALGFRRFRPPLRAMIEAGRGYPTEVSAWGKDRSVYGKVVGLAGPWRTSGEWWRLDTWARDEWDIAVEARGRKPDVRGQRSEVGDQRSEVRGRKSEDPQIRERNSPGGPSQILYRIYRELRTGTWFVEGVYD